MSELPTTPNRTEYEVLLHSYLTDQKKPNCPNCGKKMKEENNKWVCEHCLHEENKTFDPNEALMLRIITIEQQIAEILEAIADVKKT